MRILVIEDEPAVARTIEPSWIVMSFSSLPAAWSSRSFSVKAQAPLVAFSVKVNGTRNAGRQYFQLSIIVRNGLPPVIAAAAKGASAVGGETSERTA